MAQPLSDTIGSLIDEIGEPFTLDDLVQQAAARRGTAVTPRLRTSAEKVLEFEAPVFRGDDGRYVPRWSWFAGTVFLIVPTERELEMGVLVPGHRFIPFLAPGLEATDARLSVDGRDLVVSRTVELPISEVAFCHALLDADRQARLFSPYREEPSPKGEPSDTDRHLPVVVFDLAWYCAHHDVRNGDALEAKVLDYRTGRFAIGVRRRATIPEKSGATPWGTALEDGFARALEVRGPYETVEETAAWAWFLGGPATRCDPARSLGQFIGESPTITLTCQGAQTSLWWKGQDVWEAMVEQSEPDRLRARPDTMKGVLKLLGISRVASEVDAIIRDELFHGRRSIDRVMDRVLLGRSHEQFDPSLVAALELQVERRLGRIERSYTKKKDAVNGPLRARALALLDTVSSFIIRQVPPSGRRSVEASQELLAFMQGMAPIAQMVEYLNKVSFDRGERRITEDTLETLEASLPHILEVMDERLRSSPAPRPKKKRTPPGRRKRDERTVGAEVVQIRIELRRISPRIWRRVLVSADCTLAQLHDIIQAAMGWSGSHLHEFLVDGTTYGGSEPELFDERDEPDEEGVALTGLGLSSGRHLYYTYDFGDSWEHAITVQRVLSSVPDDWTGTPRCLAGARACPPEDCGGSPGYLRLLEIIDAAEEDLDEDDRDMRDMVGTYDPEHFDLELVNRRLSRV